MNWRWSTDPKFADGRGIDTASGAGSTGQVPTGDPAAAPGTGGAPAWPRIGDYLHPPPEYYDVPVPPTPPGVAKWTKGPWTPYDCQDYEVYTGVIPPGADGLPRYYPVFQPNLLDQYGIQDPSPVLLLQGLSGFGYGPNNLSGEPPDFLFQRPKGLEPEGITYLADTTEREWYDLTTKKRLEPPPFGTSWPNAGSRFRFMGQRPPQDWWGELGITVAYTYRVCMYRRLISNWDPGTSIPDTDPRAGQQVYRYLRFPWYHDLPPPDNLVSDGSLWSAEGCLANRPPTPYVVVNPTP